MTIYLVQITFKDGTTSVSSEGYRTLKDAQDFIFNRTRIALSYCEYATVYHLGTVYKITDVTVK